MGSYDNLTTIARALIANTNTLIARIANILTLKVLETYTTITRALITNTNIIIDLCDLRELLSNIKTFISNTFLLRTFDLNTFSLSIKESLTTFSLRSLL